MPDIRLNKVCDLEDFNDPVRLEAIREMEPECVRDLPDYPNGRFHRKSWEFAQLMAGIRQLNAVRPDSLVLAVAAGHERPIFALTNQARLVFATDIYGTGDFSEREAKPNMLVNPDDFAPFPYNRNRLVVQYMNAVDLRYEDNTFDLVFSLSSIEHFGGVEGARKSVEEMGRVCRPGGYVMFTTECIVNGGEPIEHGNLQLFSPEMLQQVISGVGGLELVEPLDFAISDGSRATVQNLDQVVADVVLRQVIVYPHIVLEMQGREFTSVSVFLRKVAANA